MTTLIKERINAFNAHFVHYPKDHLDDTEYNSEWCQKFFNIPGKHLFVLMSMAKKGSHTLLTNTLARRIAQIIETSSPREIEKYFDL